MKASHAFQSIISILLAVALVLGPVGHIAAQTPSPESVQPHLGYGIHYGQHSTVGPSLVYQLGFDWVKIYEIGQAGLFPGKRILYRMDLAWPNDWNQFRQDVATRVQAVVGAGIEAVEVHNEPNLSHEWGGRTPNAWQYTQMLRVTYTIVKRVRPSLIVVSGGLAPTITTADRAAISDLEFANEMFANGAGQWFDVFGYHPYGYNQPPEADPFGAQPLVFRRTERIRALMEQYGIYKQIWLTEFGWLRDPSEDGVNCDDNDPAFRGFAWLRVSGATQADYLVRAFEYAHLNWPWAGPMFVWNLNFNQMSFLQSCDHMRWFGLVRSNGEPTLAFRRLAAMTRYPSDYEPQLDVRVKNDGLGAEISLLCPRRTLIGEFSIENSGYPVFLELEIEAVNSGAPPIIQVDPRRARIGEVVRVYADPQGLNIASNYPVYINIRGFLNGRPISRSIQGSIGAWFNEKLC